MKFCYSLFSILMLAGCLTDDKATVLDIGPFIKTGSGRQPEIIGGTTFTQRDTLHFLLVGQKIIQESSLTFQIANGHEGEDYVLMRQNVPVEQGKKYVAGKILASDLIRRFGVGSFKGRFRLNEKVLAEKPFSLSR